MPITASAIKSVRSDKLKHEQNQAVRSELKSAYKKLMSTAAQNPAEAKAAAQAYVSKLDKAVAHGMVPKQRANRKKARLALFLQKTKP